MSSKPGRAKTVAISISGPRIMVADDDAAFLEAARDYLTSCDIEVNTVQTPEEGRRVLEETKESGRSEFDVLASDVNFGDLSETKGNEFVRDSEQLMGNAKPVLFSGEISTEERTELENNGHSVLPKKEDLTQKLAALVYQEHRKRTKEIKDVLKHETAPRIKELTGRTVFIVKSPPDGPFLDRLVFQRLKRSLIKWLESRSEPDEPILAYGKHVYSPNDMVLEVENETEAGVEHVQMLLKVFENSLGIDSNDEDEDEDDDSQGIEENDSQFHDDADQAAREE